MMKNAVHKHEVSFDFTRILFHIPSTACAISRTLKVINVVKLKVNKKTFHTNNGGLWENIYRSGP